MTTQEQGKRFDENVALAELERLRESIQAARQARQRSSDEFEAFVKSFRTPASKPLTEGSTPTPRVPETPQPAASESIDRSLHSGDSLPSPVPVRPSTESVIETPALPTAQVGRRYRLSLRSLGILAIVVMIALALLSIRWGRAVPPASVSTVRNSAAVIPNAAASPPASQSPPAAPAPAGVGISLRVIRPVWMRVVVDGRKDVEGTVQAGEPLHFRGDHSIVVRVGNGGDVLVRTGAGEEPFGATGQPRTRTFSQPSSSDDSHK